MIFHFEEEQAASPKSKKTLKEFRKLVANPLNLEKKKILST
jgi:hypothetical protein